jgi:hypothetical protein
VLLVIIAPDPINVSDEIFKESLIVALTPIKALFSIIVKPEMTV